MLIDAGADVNVITRTGATALMFATTRVDGSRDRYLRRGEDVSVFGDEYYMPEKALGRSHSECIEMLIKAGTDVNIAGATIMTAVMGAAFFKNAECLEPILRAGADVNKYIGAKCALGIAAKSGCDDCIRVLIKAGADVNSSDIYGDTPLMLAAKNGNSRCIQTLLKEGANVNKQNHGGLTALVVFTDWCKYHKPERSGPGLKSLIAGGADVNVTDNKGRTALAIFIERSMYDFLIEVPRILLDAGADVNMADTDGRTPLMLAVLNKHFRLIKELLVAGALIKRRDNEGRNALDIYTSRRHPGWVRLSRREGRPRLALLLYAAGEIPSATVAEKVSTLLQFKPYDETKLKHICRESIRKNLLQMSPHKHLFSRIPQLGLPPSLVDYLFYNSSLDPKKNW